MDSIDSLSIDDSLVVADFVEGGFLFGYFGAVLGLWINPPLRIGFDCFLGFL
jgi:hypothetical protein